LLLPNNEGKITITFKLDFDDDEIKEGNSFRSSANFSSLEQLEEKAEITSIKLKKRLKEKFPPDFKQTKLEGEET